MVNKTRRPLPAAPLSAALLWAATTANAAPADPPPGPTSRPGAAALRAELRALMPPRENGPLPAPQTLAVTHCADDGGPQTLRSVVAAAGEGDTIDLTNLACSRITLVQGAIPVLLDSLNVVGPGSDRLRIDGAGVDRVFVHPGAGTLSLSRLEMRNGASRVTGNHVTGGGCIASAGYVVLDHSTVRDCESVGVGVYGGAIYAYGLRMYTSTLSRNVGLGHNPGGGTAAFGGGAYATTIALIDSTVSGNRASGDTGAANYGYDIGGGIFSNFGGYIGASTIDGNYSRGMGGGVAVFSGVLTVVNSTISGNAAQTATGGGLDLRVFGGGTIANSTIAMNRAATGGGVYLRGRPATFTLQSSLIADNTGGSAADFGAVSAVAIDGGNNLVGVAGAGVGLPTGTLHLEPHLLPLADNGGPTRTQALAPDSPALDAGNNVAGLSSDQRGAGFPRQVGPAPDIGAFEGFVVPPPPAVTVPAASSWILAVLAATVAAIGLAAARGRHSARRVFTRFSPANGHPSHR